MADEIFILVFKAAVHLGISMDNLTKAYMTAPERLIPLFGHYLVSISLCTDQKTTLVFSLIYALMNIAVTAVAARFLMRSDCVR